MRRLTGLLAAVAVLVAAGQASAVITVYTSRALWLADAGPVINENFNSFAAGQVVGPATVFPSGMSLLTNSDIRTFGFGSIGQGLALNGTNQQIQLPAGTTAFGLDYVDNDLSAAVLAFGAFSTNLPLTGDADSGVSPDDFGFIGIIASSAAEIPGGVFSLSNEAFTIDNVAFRSFAVPEPATMGLLAMGAMGLLVRRRRA